MRQIVSGFFGIPEHAITADLSPAEVERWDSLAHLELILAIEKAYGIRFRTGQIQELKSVGAIERALADAQSGKF